MRLSLFIAGRFFRGSRREKGVPLLTFIAILGVAVSVFLCLSVQSVMSGLSEALTGVLVDFDAPLFVSFSEENRQKVFADLKKFLQEPAAEEVKGLSEIREFFGLLKQFDEVPRGVHVRAVDASYFSSVSLGQDIHFRDGMTAEIFSKSTDAIILGEGVFRSLPVAYLEEATVDLIHPFADLGPTGNPEPRLKNFNIAGILSTRSHDIDDIYVIIPQKSLKRFANPFLMHAKLLIDVDPKLAEALKSLAGSYPFLKSNLHAWYEMNAALYRAMALERIIFSLLLVLILLIAALNLTGLIRILGLTRAADLLSLANLGASTSGLAFIFAMTGFLVGLGGALLGGSLAQLLVLWFSLNPLPLPESYGLAELRLIADPLLWAMIIGIAPFLCALISYISSRRWIQVRGIK